MNRKWKNGDLAMVTTRSGREYAAVYTLAPGIDYFWHPLSGEPGNALTNPDVDARPLVLIDPEDEDSIDRLVSILNAHHGKTFVLWRDVQASLREFAIPIPPKPEEPTGLGAVVETSDGRKYVRTKTSWLDADEPDSDYDYTDLDAVCVLSEGIQ